MISPTSDLRTEFWKSRPTVSIVTGPLFVSTSAQHASAGVGIILVDGLVGNRIGVLTVVADSPAERCGQICAGDRIHSINGRNVQEWTLEKVKEAVLGPAGTSVTFVLERGDNERFAVTLTRQSQVALEQRTKALEERIQRMARELHAAHRLREEATLRRLESVIGVWRNRSTASAFMCWKSGTERWSRNRTIVTRVLHRMQNLLKARMFQVLADNATNARRVRVVERALGRWRMGAATRAFAAWHKKAAHAERRRNIVRRVALRLQRLGLARAFDAMHRGAVTARQVRRIGKAMTRWRSGAIAPAMDAWKSLVTRQRLLHRFHTLHSERRERARLSRALMLFARAAVASKRDSLKAELLKTTNELVALREVLAKTEKEVARLNRALQHMQQAHEEAEKQHAFALSSLEHRRAQTEAELQVSQREAMKHREIADNALVEVARISAERSALVQEIEKTMAIVSSLRDEIKSLQESHRRQLAAAATEREEAIAAAEREHSRELSALQMRLIDERETALRTASHDHATAMAALQASKQSEIDSLYQQYSRRLDLTSFQYEQRIELITHRQEEAIASAVRVEQLKLEAEMESSRLDRARLDAALQAQTDLEAALRARDSEAKSLQQASEKRARDMLLMELEAAEQRRVEDIARALRDQQDQFEQHISRMQSTYSSELAEQRRAQEHHWREELAARVDSWNQQNASQRNSHQEEVERMELAHRNNVERIELRHQATIRKMRIEMEELMERLSSASEMQYRAESRASLAETRQSSRRFMAAV